MKKMVIILIVAAAAGWLVFRYGEQVRHGAEDLLPQQSAALPGAVVDKSDGAVRAVAKGLDIPWEVAFLPGGDMLVTERPGTLKRLGEDGSANRVEGVHHIGEGGLLGMALHPEFERDRWIYLYLTTNEGGSITNRVDRYRLEDDTLTDRTTIVQNIPGARYHDGGRIAFGPDGKLYVTTGDAGEPHNAQDRGSLAGKILRLNDDGSVPRDNPFGDPVWSYGHRNPQGLAWDDRGRLWATEHGRSGIRSGFDEINLIEEGKNYGWPEIQGDETKEGLVPPFEHSGPRETWAPAGAVWHEGSLLFAGLRGETLYQLFIGDNLSDSALVAHFDGQFGRLRAVVKGPDDAIYLTTSNTDGRGSAVSDDDRIIRVPASVLRPSSELRRRFR